MNEKGIDTIYALATPPGKSAIAVIRVSGPEAGNVPGFFGVACPFAGHFKVSRLKLANKVLDQVILLFMKGPLSSTGEDVCEIHCHGSQAVVDFIFARLATASGLRLAMPGEFTRRSLLNDKLDLCGVEGLADLIDAQTPAQLHQAWAQIDGALRKPVMAWRAKLIDIAAQLETLIDFSDEDLPLSIEQALRKGTKELMTALSDNLNDGGVGELVRDGVVVALVGPVNVGKSTILNGLIGRDAAIVSNQAGTTRDIIQVQLDLQGVPTTILDTAGIRETSGMIESEGIKRSIEAAANADLVLIVLDGSDIHWRKSLLKINNALGFQNNEAEPIHRGSNGLRRLYIMNKADLSENGARYDDKDELLVISAKKPSDIKLLIAALAAKLAPLNHTESSAIITRHRHRQAIEVAYQALSRALSHNLRDTPELAAEEFRLATDALGRVTGEIDIEELLDNIFSSFCIGK